MTYTEFQNPEERLAVEQYANQHIKGLTTIAYTVGAVLTVAFLLVVGLTHMSQPAHDLAWIGAGLAPVLTVFYAHEFLPDRLMEGKKF